MYQNYIATNYTYLDGITCIKVNYTETSHIFTLHLSNSFSQLQTFESQD